MPVPAPRLFLTIRELLAADACGMFNRREALDLAFGRHVGDAEQIWLSDCQAFTTVDDMIWALQACGPDGLAVSQIIAAEAVIPHDAPYYGEPNGAYWARIALSTYRRARLVAAREAAERIPEDCLMGEGFAWGAFREREHLRAYNELDERMRDRLLALIGGV